MRLTDTEAGFLDATPINPGALHDIVWVPFEGPGWLLNLLIVSSLVPMPLSIALIVRGTARYYHRPRPTCFVKSSTALR
jgi:hypothetical protein